MRFDKTEGVAPADARWTRLLTAAFVVYVLLVVGHCVHRVIALCF